jgi:hypothetical protein
VKEDGKGRGGFGRDDFAGRARGWAGKGRVRRAIDEIRRKKFI